MPRWGDRMDQLERVLSESYAWCVVAHGRYHTELGAGAFSCALCSADEPASQAFRSTASQGMARPHWINGRAP